MHNMESSSALVGNWWSDWFFAIAMISTAVVACHFGEFIRRLLMFLDEFFINKEKRMDKLTAFKSSMSVFGTLHLVLSTLCTSMVIWYSISRSSILSFLIILSFSVSYLILHLTGMWKPSPAELKLSYGNQNNFGYCFAWQYYLGYLKIVLPDLQKRINRFEEESEVLIRVHKLILLMPKSCQLVHDLSQHPGDENIVEFVKNLETIHLDRAGSKERTYKTSVYRIQHATEPIYCCMEGIAMINSLHEMNQKCKLDPRKMQEEFYNFQTALKCILEKEKMDNLVEIIVYEDKDEKNGLRRISDVVIERMAQLAANDIPISC